MNWLTLAFKRLNLNKESEIKISHDYSQVKFKVNIVVSDSGGSRII